MTEASHRGATGDMERIATLYELTRAIRSVSDFDELLSKISQETVRAFHAEGCMIRLLEGEKLRVRTAIGLPSPPPPEEETTVTVGEGIAGRALLEGRTIVASEHEFGTIAPSLDVKTAMCTPLKIGDQVIGTFGLFNKTLPDGTIVTFTDEDAAVLEGFAAIVAIVIDKSILYEKTLAQEREAEALRDYLQGIVENSADAIITTDLDSVVTSWNLGAERTYGYTKEEAVGRFMPIIPEFLMERERELNLQVRDNKTLKEIEATRRTKEGAFIDVSLTLSPIKDSQGNIIGISGISRDITEKKRTEKDLMKKNSMLSRLFFINSVMRGTLELDKLLRMVLTAVTMGDGLGFNRAMLFLLDDSGNSLRGAMGVGPSSHEEAWHIWSTLSMEKKDLQTLMDEIEKSPLRKDSFMDRLCCGIEIPLEADTILTRSVKEKVPYNVPDVHSEPLSDTILIQQLGTMAYAVVPLISQGKVIGVIWVDNLFSRRPITADDIDFLKGFTDQIASAIENARLFEHVARAEQELENIFEAISDFVYFSSKDYTLRKVNRAVLERFNLPEKEIVGRKCYEVFHGMNEPWQKCPHHKTLMTKQPYIEELDDPNMGGTYLISSSPILDSSGEVQGTVHIARDVSEIKRLREKVASAERMAALGHMAAKVAHEIRNPLALIGGFARRLEAKLTGEQREYTNIIVEEVKRLEDILKDTLSFVKATRMERKPVDLNDLIDNVVHLLEPGVLDRGNVIRTELEQGITVTGDKYRLKEALLNIIANANEATDNGNITIRLFRTERSETGQDTDIEIEDDGCGIRKEDLERIFDPFFTTRPAGTGLGLSITKRIIEEHRGRIEVESEWGRGTKFRIHLPTEDPQTESQGGA